MLRRVVENVVVATVASAVTWAMSNPDDSAGAADALVDGAVSRVATYGSPLLGWLWAATIGLLVAGVVLQILAMAPPHPSASWQWVLFMPSWSTNLMGIGLGLGLTSTAVGFADGGSWWTLPLLAVVAYWGYRWVSGIRYRWTRMANAL